MGEVEFEKINLGNKTIVKRTFNGVLSISEIIDSFHHLLENELKANSDINIIITDVTKAQLNFSMKEFRKMLVFIKNDNVLSKLKLVVIVDSPIKTVFPTLASTIIGIKIIPFSTLKGAFEWAEVN